MDIFIGQSQEFTTVWWARGQSEKPSFIFLCFCFPKIMIAFHVLLERMDRYSSDLHEYLIVTGLEHVHFGNLEPCFQVIIMYFGYL